MLNDSCLERICWQKTVYWHWLILKWHILWFIVAIYFYAEHHLWFLWFNMSSNIARPFAWSDTVKPNSKFVVIIVVFVDNNENIKFWICYYCIRSSKRTCYIWRHIQSKKPQVLKLKIFNDNKPRNMSRESQCQYSFLPTYSLQTRVIF